MREYQVNPSQRGTHPLLPYVLSSKHRHHNTTSHTGTGDSLPTKTGDRSSVVGATPTSLCEVARRDRESQARSRTPTSSSVAVLGVFGFLCWKSGNELKQRLELPYLAAGSRSGCAVFDFGDFGAVDLLPETTSLGCLGWSSAAIAGLIPSNQAADAGVIATAVHVGYTLI
ncbi:hypothetical protein Droror1_Dr00016846 [Drosera rotundifolia]